MQEGSREEEEMMLIDVYADSESRLLMKVDGQTVLSVPPRSKKKQP